MLVFFSAIRRELSFVPDMLVPKDFILLGQSYDWWEDSFLLVVTLTALGSLIYSWRYVVAVLKGVPKWLYAFTGTLLVFQYLGEHHIGFDHNLGVWVEEVSEGIIYLTALIYLWRFKLTEFNQQLQQRLPTAALKSKALVE